MNKNIHNSTDTRKPLVSKLDESMADDGVEITAQPKATLSSDEETASNIVNNEIEKGLEFGKMNLKDAKESGYTDKEGKAVSMARKDKKGSPTGAYTDIGAGRSSAVRPADKKSH